MKTEYYDRGLTLMDNGNLSGVALEFDVPNRNDVTHEMLLWNSLKKIKYQN